MSADEYVPSDEQVRTTFVEGASEDAYAMSWHEPYAEAYDRWLASHDARVRRDAAREALDGLASEEAELHSRDLDVYKECDHAAMVARIYRDAHYPEETP